MSHRPVAIAATLLALAACGRSSPGNDADSPSPPVTASAPATASAVPTSATTTKVPVYYLGGPAARPVLYREFRSVAKSDAVVRTAVEAMLHLTPLDTDYRTYWPVGSTVLGVTVSGGTATVDLSADARDVTTSTANERQSLQQLVHTVTAADPAVTAVRVTFGGQVHETLWGHAGTNGTLTRAAQSETLAAVWVIEPAHHASVHPAFTVTGTASVFEATVSWNVTRGGAVLAHGFVDASTGAPGRGDYTVHVTLPAGTAGDVVFTAWESSAEDGSVVAPDSKTYAVS
jgi:predicted small lipoprotein YifL